MKAVIQLLCCATCASLALTGEPCMTCPRDLSPQQRAAEERLSCQWPPDFAAVARNAMMFGDGRLDSVSVRILLRTADRAKLRGPQTEQYYERAFWRVLNSMCLDKECEAKRTSELQTRAREANGVPDAAIFLARFRPRGGVVGLDSAACEVVRQSQRVCAGESVELKNDECGRAVVYLAIGRGVSPGGLERLMANDALLPFVVDACALNPIDSRLKDTVIAAALRSGDRWVHCSLVNLILQKEPFQAKALLDKLRNTLPQTTIDGQRLSALGTGSLEMLLDGFITCACDLVDLKRRYLESRTSKRTVDFFRTREKNADLARVKAWLVYRYHASDFAAILEDVRRSPQVVDWHLEELATATLEYASLAPAEGVSCTAVRQYAIQSQTATDRANAVKLLEAVATDKDIPLLRTMAADSRVVEWERGDRSYHGPLVAFRAVHCLSTIRSPASIKALHEVAKDPAVPERARDMALKALEQR